MANEEIEIKIEILDEAFFLQLKKRISQSYECVEHVHQHDVYYTPKIENYMDEKYPYKWLRIRSIDDGCSEVCFKHFYPEKAKIHTYCNEYQTAVKDLDSLVHIFYELEFRELADVDKKRDTYSYGRYLISFDDVLNLGKFVEIEVKDIKYDESEERVKLNGVVKKLGLSSFPVDYRGYPYRVYEQRHKQDAMLMDNLSR